MSVSLDAIQKGMDVYGSDGEKIGTVAETATAAGGVPGGELGAGGGPGALGDEDRVYGGPGAGGGAGSLGDEERVATDASFGGTGALGDEEPVTGGGGGGSQALGTEERVGVDTRSGALGDETRAGSDYGTGGGGSSLSDDTAAGDDAGIGAAIPGGAEYFEVDHGGFLGIGAKALYVPFSAVQEVVPGDRVVLSCTREECESRFGGEA
ncbi:MAG: hypothetical protein JOZ41_08205 [Chloroflexi bacterium]|nr:hypothetical protein [Chloroflexota bacterium]